MLVQSLRVEVVEYSSPLGVGVVDYSVMVHCWCTGVEMVVSVMVTHGALLVPADNHILLQHTNANTIHPGFLMHTNEIARTPEFLAFTTACEND